MITCLIPARGGSKRIKGKNIRPFHGFPIIAWSIEVAKSSGLFDRVVVSTDASDIAGIAQKFGAETPFQRSAKLSDDFTGTSEVVCDAAKRLGLDKVDDSIICCLYPTAPFVTESSLEQGLANLADRSVTYSFSATEYRFPVQRSFRMNDAGRVEMLFPEHFHSRSQDLPTCYHDAGQFYFAHTMTWLSDDSIFGSNSCPVSIPHYLVQDIDTPADWAQAEVMFGALFECETDLPRKTLNRYADK